MKLRFPHYLQLSAALVAITMTGAYAQSAVSQSFTGTSLPTGFTTAAATTGTTAINFSSAGADFSGTGDSGRNYIATAGTDYISTSFNSSINLTNNTGTDGAFFGLGNGAFGVSNEPGGNGLDSIYFRLTTAGAAIYSGGPFSSSIFTFTTNPTLGDPLTLGLTYNATLNDVVFTLTDDSLIDPSTQVSSAITLGSGSEAFTASNSAIFFGGSGNGSGGDPVFTNLNVGAVPEPPTWTFLAMGLFLGIPLWRFRRLSAQS